MPRLHSLLWSLALSLALPAAARAGGATVLLSSAKGEVTVRGPGDKSYGSATQGRALEDGTRVRTGPGGEAMLRFPDGTESRVRERSEIVVRPSAKGEKQPSSVTLFFGRLWSKVVKSSAGEETFEVHSANAVAGVRGTEFEVGVADDGSARVVVSEGKVEVDDEEEGGGAMVGPGYEVESDESGKLGGKKKSAADPDWQGWFGKRARQLEKQGLKVAKDLDGRLNRRKAKVEKLLAEQRALRQDIERLETRRAEGDDVDGELTEKLAKLERVTERLEDMKSRLEGAFGLFERWGALAEKGGAPAQLGKMAEDVARIAADFADMIEEGTDLSEEGMDDMMKEMREGKTDKPKKTAKDELF